MCDSDGCEADPAMITKSVQLFLSLWALLFTVLIYPFLRLYFCCKYGPKFSFGDFCKMMFERHVNEVLTPLLEKEDKSALKELRKKQKDKAKKKDKKDKKDKEKETATPQQQDDWHTSLILKGKYVIQSVYSLETLKDAGSAAASEMAPTSSASEV